MKKDVFTNKCDDPRQHKKSPDEHRGFQSKYQSDYFFAGAAAAGAVAGLGVMPIFFNTKSDIFASAG